MKSQRTKFIFIIRLVGFHLFFDNKEDINDIIDRVCVSYPVAMSTAISSFRQSSLSSLSEEEPSPFISLSLPFDGSFSGFVPSRMPSERQTPVPRDDAHSRSPEPHPFPYTPTSPHLCPCDHTPLQKHVDNEAVVYYHPSQTTYYTDAAETTGDEEDHAPSARRYLLNSISAARHHVMGTLPGSLPDLTCVCSQESGDNNNCLEECHYCERERTRSRSRSARPHPPLRKRLIGIYRSFSRATQTGYHLVKKWGSLRSKENEQ